MKGKDIATIAALAGAAFLSTLAFTREARTEILNRDGWKSVLSGKSWAEGYNLNAAHDTYPIDRHKRGDDTQVDHGHALTVEEHIIQELVRGNRRGAKLLHKNQTIMNYDWICRQAGIHRRQLNQAVIDRHDPKLPFEEYEAMARNYRPEDFDFRYVWQEA